MCDWDAVGIDPQISSESCRRSRLLRCQMQMLKRGRTSRNLNHEAVRAGYSWRGT